MADSDKELLVPSGASDAPIDAASFAAKVKSFLESALIDKEGKINVDDCKAWVDGLPRDQLDATPGVMSALIADLNRLIASTGEEIKKLDEAARGILNEGVPFTGLDEITKKRSGLISIIESASARKFAVYDVQSLISARQCLEHEKWKKEFDRDEAHHKLMMASQMQARKSITL